MAQDGLNVLITGDAGQLKKAIAEAERRIERFGKAADKSLGAIDKSAEAAAGSLAKVGDKGASSLAKIVDEAKKAGKGIDDVAKAAERAKDQLTKLDVAAGAVFAGLSISIGAALKSFSDFEAVLNQMAAVSGASAKDLAAFEAAAVALGAATKFSAKEAAEGMAELAKAGFTAQETLKSISGTLALAAAGGIAVGEAAATTAGALRGFGLEADQAGRVADLLATAANQSSVDVHDLAESFKYAAPAMAGTGQTIEQTTSLLAIMGNAMIKGSEAGTALRSMVVSLAQPTDQAAKILAGLKVTIADSTGKMLPLATILGQLRDKTQSWGETQRAAALATIFGREALSAVMAIVNSAPADIARMNAAMTQAAGAAEDMAAIMNRGLGAAFEQLKGSIETLAISLGKEFAPAATAVVVSAQDATNAVIAMPAAFKTAGAGALAAVTAFAGLTIAVRGLGLAFGGLRVAALAMTASLGPALPAIIALSVAVGAATIASKGYADAADAEKRATEDAHKARMDAITGARKHTDELAALTAEHDRLVDKVNRTKQEDEQLKRIQEKLTKGYPVLAEAIKLAGDKHWATSQAVLKENSAKEKLIQTTVRLAEAELKSAGAKLASRRIDLAEAEAAQHEVRKRAEGGGLATSMAGGVMGTNHSAMLQADRDIAARRAGVTAGEAALANARKKLGEARAAGAKPTGGDTFDPNPFNFTGKSKTHGKSAADVARQAQREGLDGLAFKYGQLLKANDTFKGGMAGEKEIKQAYILELKLQGLDRAKEGARLIAELNQQIKALDVQMADAQGEKRFKELQQGFKGIVDAYNRVESAARASIEAQRQAGEDLAAHTRTRHDLERTLSVAKLEGVAQERAAVEAAYQAEVQAADDAFAKETERVSALKGVSDERKARLIEEAGAVRDVRAELASLGRTKGLEDVNQRVTASVRELQGALQGLALDPSVERIADFIKGLATDGKKAGALKALFTDMAKAADDAGEGLGGASAALGVMVGHMDPLTLGMAGLVAMARDWSNAWEAMANAAERGRDLMIETAAIEAGLENDPQKAYNAKLAQIDADEAKAIRQLKQELGFNDDTALAWWNPFRDEQRAFIDAQTAPIKANAEARRKQALKDHALALDKPINQAAQEQAERDAEGAAALKADDDRQAKIRDSAEDAAIKLAEANSQRAEETMARYNEALDRLNAIDDEANRGERDNLGNLISIDARAQLDIAEAQVKHQETINDLLEREADIRKELEQLAKDEAKAIESILSEGIAQRAKTETQDKLERIQAVKDTTKEKSDQLSRDLAKNLDAQAKENAAFAETTARIRNLANQRITALNDERTAIMANVDAIRAQNAALAEQGSVQSALDARRVQAKAESTAGAASYTPQAPAAVGESRMNTGSQGGRLVWDGVRWNSAPRFHSGGVVPGRPGQEVPAILQAGERVLTAKDWAAMVGTPPRAGQMPAPGGGSSLSFGDIHIHAAGGDLRNPGVLRDLTRQIGREMGREIRQRGHRLV